MQGYEAYIVINENGLKVVTLDLAYAYKCAKLTEGVVVTAPIMHDFRPTKSTTKKD